MKLARSSFYHKPKDKSSEERKKEDLKGRIEATCLEFPCYGYRRVTEQLKREGRWVNHKKVLRLMRESDLLCRVRHKWVKTRDSKHRFARYPNLIKGMVINRLNQVFLIGYHLYPHPDRLCLPSGDTGCLFPQDHWLCYLHESGYHPDALSAQDGDSGETARPWYNSSLRPGGTVRLT